MLYLRIVKPNNLLMKPLLKSILKKMRRNQSSGTEPYVFSECEKVTPRAARRIEGAYDQNVKDTISSLKILANEMANGYVGFKNVKARRYRYNPSADSTLYASHLLQAASMLEYLLINDKT